MTNHPYKVRLTIDAEVWAGKPKADSLDIINFVFDQLDSPFFVVAQSIYVEYPDDDTTDSYVALSHRNS